jgi:hypothetical protein
MGVAVGIYIPSRLSTSKCGLSKRIRRASWTVCTVPLLPEPWKARRVGFMGLGDEGCACSAVVMYVGVSVEDMFVVDIVQREIRLVGVKV